MSAWSRTFCAPTRSWPRSGSSGRELDKSCVGADRGSPAETGLPRLHGWAGLRVRPGRAAAEAVLDRGDVELLVHLHRHLGAVGLPQVRLVGQALRVGLDADHGRTGELVEGGPLDLVGGAVREERLTGPVRELSRVRRPRRAALAARGAGGAAVRGG